MDDKSEWAGRKLAARARKVGLRLYPPSGDWVLVDEAGSEPGWSTPGSLEELEEYIENAEAEGKP